MIPVDELTEQKLKERLYSLPKKLQDAATATPTTDIVLQTCHHHHLNDEEKILMVQQLTGLVVLGFIHSYDLGREINEALDLNNPKLANSISEELNIKIFVPLKADLEANYQPIVQQPVKIATDGEKPTMPQTILQSPVIPPSPIVIKPKPQEPPPATSFPSAAPSPLSQKTTIAPPAPAQPPLPKPAVPPSPSMPGPMLIHQESGARPVGDLPSLRAVPPADQRLRDVKLDKPEPIRAAKIDLGPQTKPPTPAIEANKIGSPMPSTQEKISSPPTGAFIREEIKPITPPSRGISPTIRPATPPLSQAPQQPATPSAAAGASRVVNYNEANNHPLPAIPPSTSLGNPLQSLPTVRLVPTPSPSTNIPSFKKEEVKPSTPAFMPRQEIHAELPPVASKSPEPKPAPAAPRVTPPVVENVAEKKSAPLPPSAPTPTPIPVKNVSPLPPPPPSPPRPLSNNTKVSSLELKREPSASSLGDVKPPTQATGEMLDTILLKKVQRG